ncbi:MAG: SRPBCC family protein [Bdellovibrionales bacterium]|nr:SRPBCC family protein [Bdellovibrionales bacterium]
MAEVKATEIFNCSVNEFYEIITSYDKYNEFLSEVKSSHIVETRGTQKLVEFHVAMIKNFTYKLWITENLGKGISWVLDSGDLFKVSSGSWVLVEEAGRTKATYNVDAQFKIFIPGPIAKALVNVNLPNMMSSYHKRVKELYGK